MKKGSCSQFTGAQIRPAFLNRSFNHTISSQDEFKYYIHRSSVLVQIVEEVMRFEC
jgi:uncharacterized HAD superfamily protein